MISYFPRNTGEQITKRALCNQQSRNSPEGKLSFDCTIHFGNNFVWLDKTAIESYWSLWWTMFQRFESDDFDVKHKQRPDQLEKFEDADLQVSLGETQLKL